MGELHTMHDEMLATSLEDTEYFGESITFTPPSSIEQDAFSLNGQIIRSTRNMVNNAGDVVGVPTAVTVRRSSLLDAVGSGSIPTKNWRVTITDRETEEEETYIIEKGGDMPDYTVGFITFFLAKFTAAST